MKRNRIITVLTLSLLAAMPLQASAKAVLNLWTFDSGAALDPIKKAVDVFMKDNPEYKVNVVSVGGYNDKLVASFAAGSPPDVFQINEYYASQWAIRGFLEPLDKYITQSKFDIGSLSRKVLNIHRYKGRIYGLPKDFSTLGMYYNKNLLAEAGIPEPKDMKWSDVLAYGPKLVKTDSNNKVTQYAINTALSEVFVGAVVGGNNADIFNLDTARFSGSLDSKPSIDAIKLLADLAFKSRIAHVGDWDTSFFERGKSALLVRGPWNIPQYRKSLTKFKWGTSQMPYMKTPATNLLEAGWSMGSRSKHKEASWALLSYLGGYQGAKAMGETGYAIPAHSGAVKECKLDKDSYFTAFWESADTAIPCYRALNPAFMDAWNKMIQPKLDLVMIGKLDAEKAVKDAVVQADAEMKRLMVRYGMK